MSRRWGAFLRLWLVLLFAFVLAKLESKGMTPSSPADKRTLIRRATFDLTGLPPKPADVEAFLAEVDPPPDEQSSVSAG